MSITLRDFQPINCWQVDSGDQNYKAPPGCEIIHQYIIDKSTDRRYLNEDEGTIRFKCSLLTLGTLPGKSR
ncbi:hypothetical protein N9Y92_02490 [Chlamydiales bacterium]|nr:hypothetical protein [Chlamydiales bacterium]